MAIAVAGVMLVTPAHAVTKKQEQVADEALKRLRAKGEQNGDATGAGGVSSAEATVTEDSDTTSPCRLLLPTFQPVTKALDAKDPLLEARKKTDSEKLGIELQLARLYVDKVNRDSALEPLEYVKARRDFGFQVGVAIAAVILLLLFISRFQEFSLSFAGLFGASAKRLPPADPPAPTQALAKKAVTDPAGAEADRKSAEVQILAQAAVPPDSIALAHRVVRKMGARRQVEVFVTTDGARDLAKIARVEYILHPQISGTPIASTDSAKQFAERFIVDAEFLLYALVYLKNATEPIRLKRYINLP